MSNSIWETRRFCTSTLIEAEIVLHACRKARLPYGTAVVFLGYAIERIHQGSWIWFLHRCRESDDRARLTREVAQRLAGCIRTGHRYAQGGYRAEYLAAGQHLLQAVAARHGLASDTPPEVVWDFLAELAPAPADRPSPSHSPPSSSTQRA
jgi:hypothetical protein